MKNLPRVLFALLIGSLPLLAQTAESTHNQDLEPRNVTYCELAKNPAAYNHELVRLTAFVTHGFEDFQLAEPNCVMPPEHFSVWVMSAARLNRIRLIVAPGKAAEKHDLIP